MLARFLYTFQARPYGKGNENFIKEISDPLVDKTHKQKVQEINKMTGIINNILMEVDKKVDSDHYSIFGNSLLVSIYNNSKEDPIIKKGLKLLRNEWIENILAQPNYEAAIDLLESDAQVIDTYIWYLKDVTEAEMKQIEKKHHIVRVVKFHINDEEESKSNNFFSKKSNLAEAESLKQNSSTKIETGYKMLHTKGDGNCALYTIKKCFKTINHEAQNHSIKQLREELVGIVTSIFELLEAEKKSPQTKNALIYESYKKMFLNFSIFKQIVIHELKTKIEDLQDENSKQEMKKHCSNILNMQEWSNLHESPKVLNYIFDKIKNFGIDTDGIKENHQITKKGYEYKAKASQNGTWLSIAEINAYLLSQGFILAECDTSQKACGTVCIYKNVNNPDQKIYIHNDGYDRGERGGQIAGWHFQACVPKNEMDNYNPSHNQDFNEVADEFPAAHLMGDELNSISGGYMYY